MVSVETILIYDVPALSASLATLGVAYLTLRSSRRTEPKIHSIDDAVNGKEDSELTLRENVQDLVDGNKP